jgi:MFS superfamily sulfate permease-like transporter
MQNLHRTDYDKELRAQGVGNLLCGFAGALPMTGVIVRSSANVQAGARTRMSTILHGIWLLVFTAALAFVLRAIPTAALGAILVYTGYKLVNIKEIRHLAQYGKFPLVIYAATMIGIVVTDLLTGVLIGIALSVAKLIYQVTHLDVLAVRHDSRVDVHLKGAATFFSLPKLASTLESLPTGVKVYVHIENLAYVDHSCLDMLAHWKEQHQANGTDVEIEWDGLVDRYARLGQSKAMSGTAPTTAVPVHHGE